MTTTKPLPWHDTATCDRPDGEYAGVAAERGVCGGPMVPAGAGERIVCAACGHGRIGTPEDVAKTLRAARAWAFYEDGKIHRDRGCASCNGPLFLDRERLCAPCVEKENTERQASFFPEVR